MNMSRCVPSQTPFPIPDDELLLLDNQLCFPLYSAANAVVRAYRPSLDALDLTYPHYLVMMVLWQQNAISVKTLGEKLHLDSGTLTPLLKRLESKGLVERRRSVTDERARELWLTERGTALREQALAVPKSMVCKFDLDLDELVMLKQLCDRSILRK
ncbi:MarR family winged helix-turn-helix transcriptional regulator [Vibrio furnissii]|uniref:MarR family winged helix-turn-helix transcriptional regulator n=1 Tax=Vibrio furnissii TaxID=29494 RepID=UPI001EEBF514|nr:MarR family transcriptional regulator [Vibrio furnissii]MCG6217415.1 MarR family transcriptional regulator [Vibrio furnissii]